LVNAFFYFYIILENSFINLVTRIVFVYFLYKILKTLAAKQPHKGNKGSCKDESSAQEACCCLSEESMKAVYAAVYTGLNKFARYMRNIIEIKLGRLSVAVSHPLPSVIVGPYNIESSPVHVLILAGQALWRQDLHLPR
jgi:hypothetical protein